LAAGTPKAIEVRFRLMRQDDVPASNPLADEYVFGLQDTKQQIVAGVRQADGKLAFDFSLTAKPGPDPDRPRFSGRFASGPADDRFVYLSWRSMERGDYINRVKARLADIDWKLVQAAETAGQPLVADLTGRKPGGGKVPVAWRLGGA
jgi:hypothetical protein